MVTEGKKGAVDNRRLEPHPHHGSWVIIICSKHTLRVPRLQLEYFGFFAAIPRVGRVRINNIHHCRAWARTVRPPGCARKPRGQARKRGLPNRASDVEQDAAAKEGVDEPRHSVGSD